MIGQTKAMGFKFILTFILFSLLSCSSQKEDDFKKCTYCTVEQKYCMKTILDTSQFYGNFLQHFTSYTSIKEQDSIENLIYDITWGNCTPDIDWGVFTKYSFDTLLARKKLEFRYENKPIYFIRFNTVNDRKYITICNEWYGMGIIIHSNYYSDSLNILIQTTYVNQYDYSKIDLKKHFAVLENTDIVIR